MVSKALLFCCIVCCLLVSLVTGQTEPNSFDRIMIIVFENQPNALTMLHSYFKHLANDKGTHLTKYYAITHPSQPNYIAQIAGDYFDFNKDAKIDLNYTMLADLMERKGLTWKAYQEDYPADGTSCYLGSSYQKLYYRKHNPFMSFTSVSQNVTRCVKHIVNANQLYIDIERNDLPHLMYYTPNINNDGHDTGLKYANAYLSKFLPPLLENPQFMKGTLIVVTFDEDDMIFFNKVYCVLLGDMVKPGAKDNTHYTHYSLLRTIEDNFQLGTLGRNDAKATSFGCFKKRN